MKRNIAAFFRYARARHQIYLNRVAGTPREKWTKDHILRTYRFTNVFRELDKTTRWFADHVRDPMRQDPNVLMATVVFRLLNRIEVGEAVFNQVDIEYDNAFAAFMETGKVSFLKRAIVANCGDGPYVTGAYIISSPKGYSKLDGVLNVINDFNKNSDWWAFASEKGHTLENMWEFLRGEPYLGPFHAYEIVTDLRHTALLDSAPDIMTWANPGPGAHRGANRVFRGSAKDRVSREQVIDEMRILLSWSRDAKYWPQQKIDTDAAWLYDHQWPTWEMRDVEHTLCEFDKYERVRLGEGKPRGVYR